MKRIQFRLTAYTDPAGKWNNDAPNKGNEDNLFVDADLGNAMQGEFEADKVVALSEKGMLMVVADGMGGMNAGEVASKIAIDTVERCFASENISKVEIKTAKAREAFMEKVVEEADTAIKTFAKKNKECEGMGSTLILAWLCHGQLSVTWCGDSRAYLFRGPSGLRQVSKDHSYVQEQVDAGILTPDQAFDSPYGNIITRSLGDPEKKAVADSLTFPVYKGDILMLCSDGLSGVLRDREMSEIMAQNRSSMRACREALWQAAENADWYDNVTAILCEITEGETCPPEEMEYKVFQEPVSKTDIPGNGAAQPSVISFKVRKRTLRRVAAIVAAIVVVLALGWFVKAKFLAGDAAQERWRSELEGVRKLASENGLTFYCDSVSKVLQSDGLDSLWVADLKDAVAMQVVALERLDRIRRDAGTGFSDFLGKLMDSVRNTAFNGDDAVSQAEQFKDFLDVLCQEMDVFYDEKALNDRQKEGLNGLKDALWKCKTLEELDQKRRDWENFRDGFSSGTSKKKDKKVLVDSLANLRVLPSEEKKPLLGGKGSSSSGNGDGQATDKLVRVPESEEPGKPVLRQTNAPVNGDTLISDTVNNKE